MLTQYQLKNKLKVILVESHKAPVVTVQMWVKTGSADEKKRQEGISHFIEHLLFKGTRKYGVGEIAKTVEKNGGELNAFTTFDHTVFHVTISKEQMEVAMDCISEMIGFPKFDSVEIDREREVVIEEIKRSKDNPHSEASHQLFETVFKKHPYGIPVIGYTKNIEVVSRKVLVDYYHDRYVPSNMALVIAGDFDGGKIKSTVQQYFGTLEPSRLRTVKRTAEPPIKKPRIDYKTSHFQEPMLYLAFPVPAAKHKDVPGIDVWGYVLGQGDSSRLVKRLRLERPLVNSVHAGAYNPMDAGLFTVGMQFQADNFDALMTALTDEMCLILSQPPTWEELQKAKINLEAEELYSLETVDGLAHKVGTFQTLLNNANYMEGYLKAIQAIKPGDLHKLAKKYMHPDRLVATLMIHQDDAKKISQAHFEKSIKQLLTSLKAALKRRPSGNARSGSMKASQAVASYTPAIKATLSSSKSSGIEKITLKSGGLLLLKRNPEVPIFHLKVGFLGGLRDEPAAFSGVTTLLSNTWTAGSKNFTENEINEIIENCAGSLSAFGGRNSCGLSLESLTASQKNALKLFEDVLLRPQFSQEAVVRESMIQMEHLRTRQDHPSSLTAQLFMETMFAGHPYGRDMLGSTQYLQNARSQDLSDLWGQWTNSSNAFFSVVGDFNPQDIKAYVENLASSLVSGQRKGQPISVEPITSSKEIFKKIEKQQTHIIMGFRGLSFADPERYTLQVLQAILAGQGGRLFLELRDKESLAYTVTPVQMEGIETGYFGVYIGCSPEKGTKSVAMIRQELERIASSAPSDDEVQRAKLYLVGRNHIDLQRNSAQASSVLFDEMYGVDCEETFRYAEHLQGITTERVRSLAQRLFDQPSVSVAVGSESPF